MEQLSDTDLMELVKQGDYCAFDELYKRYRGPISRFLFSLTWDQEMAEDCLQEVFFRLFQARHRYQPTGKFSTYVFQIAKNYYIGLRRKERNRSEKVSIVQERADGRSPLDSVLANERLDPEAHLMQEYRRWRIRRAIQMLSEGQKLVFVMSHFEDMKYTEIAEVLQIPVGTVKSRMFKAVSSLRALLKEEMP